MREMGRIGEASFTIVRTPSLAAVWVIAFIRWCLGVEPYIRRMLGEQLVLKQSQSCVLVEIGEYQSTDFSVKTFKATGGIQELLWESKTRLIKPSAWNRLINIKTYFQTQLRKIQSSYRLPHLTSTSLSLASEFEHCFNGWKRKNLTFCGISSKRLVALIAFLLDVKDPTLKINIQGQSELSEVWAKYPKIATDEAIELFLEMMICALLENIDDDPDLDIYVELTAYPHREIGHYGLVSIVHEFLLPPSTERALRFRDLSDFDLEMSLLSLLGTQHKLADGGLAVASSSKGQVTYLSLLETLSPYPHSRHRRVVLPGWLQHEDRRYSYMTGGEMMMNQFDLRISMVQSDDYREEPFPEISSTENFSWMLSADDDYLQIYLAPYLTRNASLNIRLCTAAFSFIKFDWSCSTTCASISHYLPDLRYCRTLEAALSAEHSSVFRVFSCSKNRIDFFYALATVGEQVKANEGVSYQSFLGVVCQKVCLGCAFRRMTQFLQDRILQDKRESKFVVFLT